MTTDMLKTEWSVIRNHARQWWGELTDDDLDEIAGDRTKLVYFIQARYGRSQEEAEIDVNRFVMRASTLLRLK